MNICTDYIKRLFKPIFGYSKADVLPQTFEVRALYSKDDISRALDCYFQHWNLDIQSGPLAGRVLRLSFTEEAGTSFAMIATDGKLDDQSIAIVSKNAEEINRFKMAGLAATNEVILELAISITRSSDPWPDGPCTITSFEYSFQTQNKTPYGSTLN